MKNYNIKWVMRRSGEHCLLSVTKHTLQLSTLATPLNPVLYGTVISATSPTNSRLKLPSTFTPNNVFLICNLRDLNVVVTSKTLHWVCGVCEFLHTTTENSSVLKNKTSSVCIQPNFLCNYFPFIHYLFLEWIATAFLCTHFHTSFLLISLVKKEVRFSILFKVTY